MTLDKKRVEQLALENGFKLKQQEDGTMALNAYVFEFADKLLTEAGGEFAKIIGAGQDTVLLVEAVARIKDLMEGDDGQAWKEARKFLEKLEKPAQEHATQLAGQGQGMHAAVRNVLRHHGLTQHGDGVVEADLIAAVLSAAPAQAQEDGPAGSGGWQHHAESMERDRNHWRDRAQAMHEHQRGECWHWQGDGGDHIESMVNTLPVVIRADALRALLAQQFNAGREFEAERIAAQRGKK